MMVPSLLRCEKERGEREEGKREEEERERGRESE
jgi:hypothetical protein